MNKDRIKFETECRNAARELELKKERLFVAKDMSRWEINQDEARLIPRSQLLEDKVLAFKVMLDNVSSFQRKLFHFQRKRNKCDIKIICLLI